MIPLLPLLRKGKDERKGLGDGNRRKEWMEK
jgi:hypothetical protein